MIDNFLAEELQKIKSDISAIANSRQPYFGDWIEISERIEKVGPDPFYMATNLQFLNDRLDPRNFFSVGDKIRLKENCGNFKYFYVVNVTASFFGVFGGLDFSIGSGTLSDLAKGITEAPKGHPVRLQYSPGITATTGTYTNIDPNPSASELTFFSMVGSIVNLSVSVTNGQVSTASSVYFTAPTRISGYYRGLSIVVGPSTGWFENAEGSSLFFNAYGTLTPPGNFGTGAGNCNFAFQCFYRALHF